MDPRSGVKKTGKKYRAKVYKLFVKKEGTFVCSIKEVDDLIHNLYTITAVGEAGLLART